MNINKGMEVYAIYSYGDQNQWFKFRKEKFIKYINSYPLCTVDMSDGVSMIYEEIWFSEKEAKSRVNRLYNKNKKGEIIMVNLSDNLIEKLKGIPETGMGFHKVNAILSNGEIKSITILNSSLIEEDINVKDIIDIK